MKSFKYLFVLLFLVVSILSNAQSNFLPHSSPEEEGVSSKAISNFIDSINKSHHEFHSFMLIRHGKIIAEGWWNPYRADLKHSLYSLSKSFTATAVGFAKAEGRLSLSDKVISYFPDQLPDNASAYLQQLTIKKLLTMSVGQDPDPTPFIVSDTNWIRSFLALPIKNEPGSTFLYNSMATYMLSAIVQKVTGETVFNYLQPRLFQPLNITGIDWETDPKGINTGGWGLRLKTEDIAKFAQLFLQKGQWNGKQILPEGWVEEASATKIIQHPQYSQAKRDSSDWEQGYCYQMWRCRHNAYRGDGAFGQYAIIMPDQDAVIAITSESADMQGELNLIWKIILPAMQNKPLAANVKSDEEMQHKLASLKLRIDSDHLMKPSITLSNKTYSIEDNPLHISSLQFNQDKSICRVTFKTDNDNYQFNFNHNKWQYGETTMHGPYLVSVAKHNLTGLPPFKVAGDYEWIDPSTLKLVLRYIESPHTETFICHFNNNSINVDVKRSFNTQSPDATIHLKGVAK